MAGILVVNLTKPDYQAASSIKDFYSKPMGNQQVSSGKLPEASKPAEVLKPAGEPKVVAGDLGYYGQWDENRNGYLEGEELTKASVEISQKGKKVLPTYITDISGQTIIRHSMYRWIPPQDLNLDQRISKLELEINYNEVFGQLDSNRDGFGDEKELSALRSRIELMILEGGFGTLDEIPEDIMPDLGLIEKYDSNLDGRIASVEIPPFIWIARDSPFSIVHPGRRRSSVGRTTSRGKNSRPDIEYTEEQQVQFKDLREEKNRKLRSIFFLGSSGRLKIDKGISNAIEREYQEKMEAVLTSEQKKKRAESAEDQKRMEGFWKRQIRKKGDG